MKKRYFLGLIVCFSLLLLLSGCGKKTAISTSKFISIAEKHNLQVENIISKIETSTNIDDAVMVGNDNWQIEFYVINSEDDAIAIFENNKNIFEESKSGSSAYSSVNMVNYSTYSLESNDEYKYLCRIDNTFLYVNVDKIFKDSVKNFINEIGY